MLVPPTRLLGFHRCTEMEFTTRCSPQKLVNLFNGMKDQEDLFKETCFRYLMELQNFSIAHKFLGFLFEHLESKEKNEFNFNGNKIKFIKKDVNMILNLDAPEEVPELHFGDSTFVKTYFGKGITEKEIHSQLAKARKEENWDLCNKFNLLYTILIFLLPSTSSYINKYANLLSPDSLELFNKYPWGTAVYDMIVNEGIPQVRRGITNAYGCMAVLQIWAYMNCPYLAGEMKIEHTHDKPKISGWEHPNVHKWKKLLHASKVLQHERQTNEYHLKGILQEPVAEVEGSEENDHEDDAVIVTIIEQLRKDKETLIILFANNKKHLAHLLRLKEKRSKKKAGTSKIGQPYLERKEDQEKDTQEGEEEDAQKESGMETDKEKMGSGAASENDSMLIDANGSYGLSATNADYLERPDTDGRRLQPQFDDWNIDIQEIANDSNGDEDKEMQEGEQEEGQKESEMDTDKEKMESDTADEIDANGSSGMFAKARF